MRMKYIKLLSILLIFSNLTFSQETEEVIDEKILLQQAIDTEASSSNDAANRQEFIDDVDAKIIVLTGDIQFLSQQLDLTNIYNRQLQEDYFHIRDFCYFLIHSFDDISNGMNFFWSFFNLF